LPVRLRWLHRNSWLIPDSMPSTPTPPSKLPSALAEPALCGIGGPMFTVRRSTFNVRRSTFNAQRSTFNAQRSTFTVQRSTFTVQRSTFTVQRPTPNAQRPTPNVQRPTPNVQRPTPNVQRLATDWIASNSQHAGHTAHISKRDQRSCAAPNLSAPDRPPSPHARFTLSIHGMGRGPGVRGSSILDFGFWILDFLRISIFGFRISNFDFPPCHQLNLNR
jgi:hypothetical protein